VCVLVCVCVYQYLQMYIHVSINVYGDVNLIERRRMHMAGV
jgi:hypothetical protein